MSFFRRFFGRRKKKAPAPLSPMIGMQDTKMSEATIAVIHRMMSVEGAREALTEFGRCESFKMAMLLRACIQREKFHDATQLEGGITVLEDMVVNLGLIAKKYEKPKTN